MRISDLKPFAAKVGMAIFLLPMISGAANAQDALFINPMGDIGIGTNEPDVPLHIQRADGTAQILVQESDGDSMLRRLLYLENNGDPSFTFRDSSTGNETEFRLLGPLDTFSVNHVGTGGADLRLTRAGALIIGGGGAQNFVLSETGNLTIAGALTQSSDVNAKRNIDPVSSSEILSKVTTLPISTWEYKSDQDGLKHIGPMAQDFYAVFGYGQDPTRLAPADMAGVAVAAIQAQQERITLLEARLATLENLQEQVENLRARLADTVASNQ